MNIVPNTAVTAAPQTAMPVPAGTGKMKSGKSEGFASCLSAAADSHPAASSVHSEKDMQPQSTEQANAMPNLPFAQGFIAPLTIAVQTSASTGTASPATSSAATSSAAAVSSDGMAATVAAVSSVSVSATFMNPVVAASAQEPQGMAAKAISSTESELPPESAFGQTLALKGKETISQPMGASKPESVSESSFGSKLDATGTAKMPISRLSDNLSSQPYADSAPHLSAETDTSHIADTTGKAGYPLAVSENVSLVSEENALNSSLVSAATLQEEPQFAVTALSSEEKLPSRSAVTKNAQQARSTDKQDASVQTAPAVNLTLDSADFNLPVEMKTKAGPVMSVSGTRDATATVAKDADPNTAPVSSEADTTHIFASVLENAAVKPDASVAAGDPQTARAQSTDTYQVISQIVDHAKLLQRPGNSEMVIKLKPEHLGELTLKITADNGIVSATFHSSNPEVRGVIESSLPQLRSDLSNSGIKVDYVGVFAGFNQSFSDQHHAFYGQQPASVGNSQLDEDDFEPAMQTVMEAGEGTASTGIDYRI